METNIILKKGTDENTLLQYFGVIHELSRSGNEFPINLDQVYHLVYSRKDKAVEVLKSTFIEGIDYHVNLNFPPNGEKLNLEVNNFSPNGKELISGDDNFAAKSAKIRGRKKDQYYLSVPCLEFFIARKVRDVFEVYRKVFHKVVERSIEGDTTSQQILSETFNKAVAERADSVVSSIRKELNFWKGVANSQQMRILELEDMLQVDKPT